MLDKYLIKSTNVRKRGRWDDVNGREDEGVIEEGQQGSHYVIKKIISSSELQTTIDFRHLESISQSWIIPALTHTSRVLRSTTVAGPLRRG